MTAFPDDVEVVVINFNGRKRLPATLTALHLAGCPWRRVTVVDNASQDGSAEWLAEWYPDVRLLRREKNDGPNPARNLGIVHTSAPYILLLDDDIMIQDNTVPLLRSALRADPAAAIASPVILFADRPNVVLYAGTNLHYLCEAVNNWQGKVVDECGQEVQEIGVAPGGAMLLSRQAAVHVNYFDEAYFIGKADGDFSQVIRIAGYKILGVFGAHVIHNGAPRGSKRYYYQIRNRWYFMLKNYQLRTLLMLLPILLLHEVLEFSLLAWKGQGLTYLRAIGGLLKMLPGLEVKRRFLHGIRRCADVELLVSGPVLISADFLRWPLLQQGKNAYDHLTSAYWRMVSTMIRLPELISAWVSKRPLPHG